MKTKNYLVAGVFALSVSSQAMASANTPTINLIPVTAVESIKLSAETARNLEGSLGQVVEKIDAQKAMYDSAKCEGSVNDRGCDAIFENLSASYKELLQGLNEELPNLSKQLNVTAKSIGKQLRKELGKNMTPVDVQRLISGKRGAGKGVLQARRSNNSHNMLSWLSGMAKAISSGSHGESTAVVASDIYVNMTLAVEQIDMMQADINQSLATIDTFNAFGQLSPAQLETVASVKTMLFGEFDEGSLPSPQSMDEPTETYDLELTL